MGFYINPPGDQSKEDWLKEHGKSGYNLETATGLNLADKDGYAPPAHYPVCWVNNGPFTAAIICYSPDEHEAVSWGFINGTDKRPHRWYSVPRDKLLEVCPTLEGVLM